MDEIPVNPGIDPGIEAFVFQRIRAGTVLKKSESVCNP